MMKQEIKKIFWSEVSSSPTQASTRTTSAFFTALNLQVQSGGANGTVKLPGMLSVASSLNWAHITESGLEALTVVSKVRAFVAPSFFAEGQRDVRNPGIRSRIGLDLFGKGDRKLSLSQFPGILLGVVL